eukprot:83258-Rhodomonas_salina.1
MQETAFELQAALGKGPFVFDFYAAVLSSKGDGWYLTTTLAPLVQVCVTCLVAACPVSTRHVIANLYGAPIQAQLTTGNSVSSDFNFGFRLPALFFGAVLGDFRSRRARR